MISILLPTRRRLQAVQSSVTSLLVLTADKEEVEILVAVDPDDLASLPETWTASQPGQVRSWKAPRRYGYNGLHHYVNFLATQAKGDWLMLWNDDARMVTPAWDRVIQGQPLSKVLWSLANHAEGGNLFPAWPKAWSDALGYVSLSPNCDVWLSEIARRLDREECVPVMVQHDRADVTGGHDDETYAEGRAQMGQGNDDAYDSTENRAARAHAVRVIKALLAEQAETARE